MSAMNNAIRCGSSPQIQSGGKARVGGDEHQVASRCITLGSIH